MVDFRRTRRHVSDSPKLEVAAGLPVGRHTVELVVTNADGVDSPPTPIRFEIVRGSRSGAPRSARTRRKRTPR